MPSDIREEEYFVEDGEDANIALLVQKINSLINNISQNRHQGRRGQGTSDFSRRNNSVVIKELPDSPPKAAIPPKRNASDSFRYGPRDYLKIQCHECHGFGHYANECANIFRKYGKLINFLSLSDDESFHNEVVEEQPNEEQPLAVALMTAIKSTVNYTFDNYNLLCFTSFVNPELQISSELQVEVTLKVLVELKESYEDLLVKIKRQNKLSEALTKEKCCSQRRTSEA